jgi:hypothetical protein
MSTSLLDPNAKLFYVVFAVTFACTLALPISIWKQIGWKEGNRWIQNYPSTTLYMWAFFPSVAGLLAVVFVQHRHLVPSSMGTIAWIGYFVLLAIAIAAAYGDFVTVDAIPFLLNDKAGRAARVRELDGILRPASAATTETPGTNAEEKKEYIRLVQPFASVGGLSARANKVAFVLFLQNCAGAAAATALILGLALSSRVHVHDAENEMLLRQLGAVYQLLLFWFPFQIYSNWYQYTLYSRETLTRQRLIFFLVLLSLVAGFLVWHAFEPGISRNIFAAVLGSTALTAVLSLVGRIKWDVVNKVVRVGVRVFQSAPFSYFVMLGVGLIIASAVAAGDFVHQPPQTSPATSVQQAGHQVPDSTKH